MTTQLLNLVAHLSSLLEIPAPLESDTTKSTCVWAITGSHTLFFSTLPSGYSVSCHIGKLPEKNREDFYLLLMRANFLGQGTNGHIIGMDQEEKFLTLSSKISYDITTEEFKELIEDFLNFVDYWRAELTKHITRARGLLI
jgi:hypothetical protein